MVPLLVALAFQVPQRPAWAVVEFRDLKNPASAYGRAAADALADELTKTGAYDVVPKEAVRRAVETLNLTSPPVGLVDLSRVGQEAFGAQTRNGTIVKGEVVDYRVKKVKGGKQALVALRVVAYDSVNILPVNGTLERGETAVMSRKTSDQVLIVDAIRQAAFVAVRTMQGQRLPTATIRMTYSRDAEIDRGSREGFKTGDTVTVLRGPIGVCTARVGKVEPERAWISAERMIGSWAPGDTVRVPYVPIPLPPAEKSVFDPPRRCFGPQ